MEVDPSIVVAGISALGTCVVGYMTAKAKSSTTVDRLANQQKMTNLEHRIVQLEAENAALKREIELLRREV